MTQKGGIKINVNLTVHKMVGIPKVSVTYFLEGITGLVSLIIFIRGQVDGNLPHSNI